MQIISRLSLDYSTSSSAMLMFHLQVDFERLYDLMSSHKIHIQKGSAIITVNELEYLIVPMFRESLISSMTVNS